jgi:Domain of unknown function (DUF4928)
LTPRSHEQELAAFADHHKFRGKGPLSVALVVTEHARKVGLPIEPAALITDGGGQVLGLGMAAVQSILKKHGITRVLAKEGGRTSRNSLRNMREYVAFLNELKAGGEVDIESVGLFWIARVQQFFDGQPFRMKLDGSRSLRNLISDLISQATARQKKAPGVQYAGAVLQYLVGAKLDCALGRGTFAHHGFSTADEPSDRAGDFLIGDVVIHVTTAPSERTIAECRTNLNDGLRPIIVTLQKGLVLAEGLATNAELADRIDIFEIEQFVALNLYELGKFVAQGRRTAIGDIIGRYNEVIDEVDTDPSLKIDLRK